MHIKRDVFRIESGGREADGTKIEPEAQSVQHVFSGTAPIGLGAGLDIVDGAPAVGALPLEVVAHSNAQQVARSVSALCANCVTGDALVLTERGAVRLRDAAFTKKTFDGSWREVTMWQSMGEKDVVEITTALGNKLKVTPDHHVLTERGWVAAGDLRPGGGAAFDNSMPSRRHRDVLVSASEATLSRHDAIDRRDALLMGLLTGDGWKVTKHGELFGLGFCFTDEQAPAFEDALSYAAERFDSREQVHVQVPHGVGLQKKPINKIEWRNAGAREFATSFDKAHVPALLWRSTPEAIGAYARGLFATDGTVQRVPGRRAAVSFYQADRGFVEELRFLLLTVGIGSTFHETIRAPQYKNLSALTIARKKDLERFIELVGFMDARRASMLGEGVRLIRDRAPISEGVRSVLPVGREQVFDISVPKTERFFANGLMVHNCRYFDRAGWLKMLAVNEGPAATQAERHSINAIRAEIILNMPDPDMNQAQDGDYDVEHAMKSMGLCHALREFYKGKDGIDEPHGVWPTSGCPTETCTPDRPAGLFVPKDGDARKASQQNYDAVMLRAAGKVITP